MIVTKMQWEAMEATLSNDESSTDEELESYFVAEVGVTIEIAQFAIIYRDDFLTADPNAAVQPSLSDLWGSGGIADEARAERGLSPGYGS
jgi:hypothetical protein